MKIRKVLAGLLRLVDLGLGVAQWFERRKSRTKASDVLDERRARAQAPTVVLGRRRPPPPR